MKSKAVQIKPSTFLSVVLVGAVIAFFVGNTRAEPISSDAQAKADHFKKKLVEWAASPAVIAAVKESNSKGGLPGLSNAKWDDLADTDPLVKGLSSSVAGKQVTKWEGEDKALNKLNLRDEKGNLAAFSGGSGKPLLYNNAPRPPFKNGLNGAWSDKEIKPDPTTQKKSVQISAPIMDGGKAIGVIHGAVEVQ